MAVDAGLNSGGGRAANGALLTVPAGQPLEMPSSQTPCESSCPTAAWAADSAQPNSAMAAMPRTLAIGAHLTHATAGL